MAPKIVVNVEGDSPVDLTITVSNKPTADSSLASTGVEAEVARDLKKGEVQKEPKSGAESSSGQKKSSIGPKAEQFEDEWEKVMEVDDEGGTSSSPRPPSHSPPSPHPPGYPPPWKSSASGASGARSSAAPDAAQQADPMPEVSVDPQKCCVTRKAGKCYHVPSCGMMKKKRPTELFENLEMCPRCVRELPRADQRFAFSGEDPRKLHLVANDHSTFCMLHYGAVVTGCRQCVFK